ncbi:MAG: inorganic phosphate transporter [Flavobacteriales bacterium]|nr:inorganic phosphate transporter [Flavobacteriales bacterium]
MILLFLSSGLFLGWSLGANDAANIFGSAVGTKMVKFRTAAIIGSIFVILGAVIQGSGATHTLGKLGQVNALAGSFTVALAAAITVFTMTKYRLPVSTSQAIVGAIIGWNLYTGNETDSASLTKIVSTWIFAPILGGIFAVILYQIQKKIIERSKIHLIKLDSYLRIGLLVVGAFGAYSLGANNIANVMGVFMQAAPTEDFVLGPFSFTGVQQLFFLGALAIGVGIITYSKKIMSTVGNRLFALSTEAALIVVLAHSLVLFVFSSQGLSDAVQSIGLPAIPLVPVSSSQAIVGAILGIGILKGAKEIKLDVMGGIAIGWVTTPIAAGIITFFSLFFMEHVFKLEVQNTDTKIELSRNERVNINQEHNLIINTKN